MPQNIRSRAHSAPPRSLAICVAVLAAATLAAQWPPTLPAETLLDRAVLKALDEELSGAGAVSFRR